MNVENCRINHNIDSHIEYSDLLSNNASILSCLKFAHVSISYGVGNMKSRINEISACLYITVHICEGRIIHVYR